VLQATRLRLATGIAPVTFGAEKGEIVGVMGLPNSCAPLLFPVLSGKSKPAGGSVKVDGSVEWLERASFPRGKTVQEVAKEILGTGAKAVTDALQLVELFDLRKRIAANLNESDSARLRALALLRTQTETLALAPPLLDWLDPWTNKEIWRQLKENQSQSVLFLETARPDVASRCDLLLVFGTRKCLFYGSPSELLNWFAPYQVQVLHGPDRASNEIVERLNLSVEEDGEIAKLVLPADQEVAALLLKSGLSGWRTEVTRKASFEEAILALESLD
jgi:ABC-type multidrug transport system ATPase subunit